MGLREILSRIGYDQKIGPLGSFTLGVDDDAPHTVPLMPGLPGLVMKPKDRALTDVERGHEGAHVSMGAPGAVGGKLAGLMLGTKGMAARIDPDEALAYMSQPNSAETTSDMRVQASQGATIGGLYGKLLEYLAKKRMSQ